MDQYIGKLFSSPSWSDVNVKEKPSWACGEPVEPNMSIPNLTRVSNMSTVTSNPMMESSTIHDTLSIILGAEPDFGSNVNTSSENGTLEGEDMGFRYSDDPSAFNRSLTDLQALSACQQWQHPASYGDVSSFSPAMRLNRIQDSGLQGGNLDDDADLRGSRFIEMDKILHLDSLSAYAPSEENQGMPKYSASSFAALPLTFFDTAAGECNGTGKPRVRARRGQATDPHSIAERLRREKISVRMKNLQELVPNSNKNDKASMLDEIIEYVKFLQLQVKVLSMSRLGAAGAVAPLITEKHSEAFSGFSLSPSAVDFTLSPDQVAFEREVVKLMESNVTLAMQHLQTKGLCLMPIALAAAISSRKSSSLSSLASEERKIFGYPHNNNGSSSSSNSSLPGIETCHLSPDGDVMVGNFNGHGMMASFCDGGIKLEAENTSRTPGS